MATELFTNDAAGTVTSGGTTAPPAGTAETWTVSITTAFPAAASGVTQFHVADPAAPSEKILVTAGPGNTGTQTWTVTRGHEGTVPVAHVPGFTVRSVITAGWLSAVPSLDWLNVTKYGATGNGSTDDSAAIASAIAAATAGQTVYLPAGTYLLNGSTVASVATAGVRLAGSGPKSTTIQIGAGFTGAQAIFLNAEGCAVENLSVTGATSTTTANPAADAIYLNGQRFCRISNVEFEYINGWCVNSVATSASAGYGTMLAFLSTYKNCAGGIHVKGVSGSSYAAQHFLSDVNFQQIGVSSGANANLDAFRFEDCEDITGQNFNASVSAASSGNCLNIMGACSTCYFTNTDIGTSPNWATTLAAASNGAALPQATINVASTTGAPSSGTVYIATSSGLQAVTYTGTTSTTLTGCSGGTGTMSAGGVVTGSCSVIRIQDSANGSPDDIRFTNGTGQQGLYGLYATGGAQNVTFMNYRFFNNYLHGSYVNTGAGSARFTFTGCQWAQNGQAGANSAGLANVYDMEWTGAATGEITGGSCVSPVVASGHAGVQDVMDFTGAGVVSVHDMRFDGSGTTSGTCFAAAPKYTRNILPYNPRGSVSITVPASGSATASRSSDMEFVIAAATAGPCAITGAGAPQRSAATYGTTSGGNTITDSGNLFTPADVGKYVTGPGIPATTFITAVASPGSATISNNATATAAGVTLTIQGFGVPAGTKLLLPVLAGETITPFYAPGNAPGWDVKGH